MLCNEFPGGVVAGVAGIERALLRLVSIDMPAFALGAPLMPCWPHEKFSDVIFPITLEALVGGVGNVWALSSDGRADAV